MMDNKNLKIQIILFLILLLSLFLRIINLTALPIFTDEAIYIRWTQIANMDPAWRFISLTDGKQPLFIWLNMVSQRFFTEPLFAGRLISVIAGIFTTLGLFFLGKVLFNLRVGIFCAFVWAIFPMALWHDRLTLMDSLLACFFVWGLWLEILLIKTPRLDIALFLGMIIGGGLLTKSSAQFLLYLIPLTFLLRPGNIYKPKEIIFKWIGLVFIAAVVALSINWVQRLSPFYYIVGLKNLTFIYSLEEISSFSVWQNWQRFWGNLYGLCSWLITYFSYSFLFLLIFPILKKDKYKEKLYLWLCFLIPFLALAFFGKVLYSRFLLFMTIPLVILIARGLESLSKMKNRFLLFTFYFLLFTYSFYFDYQILFNQVNTPLPPVDRGQYLDDWPAGWGINEVVDYLKKESAKEKITIGTEGTFGLTPAALEIYLSGNQNIEIKGFWPISDGITWLKEKAKERKTFVMFKDTQQPDSSWPLELVAKYKRGRGENYLSLYFVRP